MVTYLPAPATAGATPPQIAFAVSRKVGSAVVRNRVRRQLREAARALTSDNTETADATLRGGSVLVASRPAVIELTFAEVQDHLRRAVVQATRSSRAPA